MDRITRRELKQDELRTTFEHYEHYLKEHYREILGVTGILVVVVGLVVGLRLYAERRDAEANAELGIALKTFRAYVGMPAPGTFDQGTEMFPVASEKYKKALGEFSDVARKFPRTKAAEIARYHMGICQSQLGNKADALKTLEEAGKASDMEIATLAQFALAGELVGSGKPQEAGRIYQHLADHPTSTVPQATALLALADTYRTSQPAQARQIYQRLEKDFAGNSTLAQTLKQQLDSLPK